MLHHCAEDGGDEISDRFGPGDRLQGKFLRQQNEKVEMMTALPRK
jgi:hypothetical protein